MFEINWCGLLEIFYSLIGYSDGYGQPYPFTASLAIFALGQTTYFLPFIFFHYYYLAFNANSTDNFFSRSVFLFNMKTYRGAPHECFQFASFQVIMFVSMFFLTQPTQLETSTYGAVNQFFQLEIINYN